MEGNRPRRNHLLAGILAAAGRLRAWLRGTIGLLDGATFDDPAITGEPRSLMLFLPLDAADEGACGPIASALLNLPKGAFTRWG